MKIVHSMNLKQRVTLALVAVVTLFVVTQSVLAYLSHYGEGFPRDFQLFSQLLHLLFQYGECGEGEGIVGLPIAMIGIPLRGAGQRVRKFRFVQCHGVTDGPPSRGSAGPGRCGTGTAPRCGVPSMPCRGLRPVTPV